LTIDHDVDRTRVKHFAHGSSPIHIALLLQYVHVLAIV